jgi:two-component system, cell cycle sensor histidine kinase and response regulator CckA
MKVSLQTKVSVFVTLIIVAISAVSTVFFTTAYKQSTEKGLLSRGSALSYSLSKAAEDGLIHENLDLIQKASNVIKAPDVSLAQVFSDLWDAIDAYPLRSLKNAPNPRAVVHFKDSIEPFAIKIVNGYDFYNPIIFRVSEDARPVAIGFVRIILSSDAIENEERRIIVTNVMVSAAMTLFAILSINLLMGRIVTKPLMALYRSMSMFKHGVQPEIASIPEHSAEEIRELSAEFIQMCRTIKEKEERLIESDKRIRSLFERVEHAIFRLDSNGNVLEANSTFKKMFGDVSELSGVLVGESVAPECLRRAVAERGLHTEDRAIGKRGDELLISLSLYPDTHSSGEIRGFDGYIIDVTEKKRLEDRLMRAQKMEAVGTLAGGMAHDFNNLLTAILGYAEIILSMTNEGDQFHRPATIIYDAARRGADFGKRILTITQKEKIEAKPVNINDVIKNSMELLQRSIPKSIEIAASLQEGIPNIKADPSQIQQVIMNLVVNARDAMPKGGKLSIETGVTGNEMSSIGLMHSGGKGFVKLSVSDTGIGIDTVTQTKIFDPFYTTKELGKGTGLGLYIVNSIVSNHGGFINLYSEPLKGTRFTIYMPVARDSDGEESSQAQDITGSGNILVIDDEPDVRELCRDMLEPLGYSVQLAESGKSGIAIFREMKGRISVVILDMIMPGMGGNEVFQSLKHIDPEVKVLICSGFSQHGFAGIEELLKSGAAGFIQKPFTRHAIAVLVKKFLTD